MNGSKLVDAFSWTLVHFTWQATIVALLLIPAPVYASNAGQGGGLPAQELTDEQKLVRDFVLMKMKKGVLAKGKISTSSREHAIAVVSIDGANVPEVRTILLDELEKSFDDPNGNFVRQRLLRVARNLLELEGNDRWAYEYEANGLNKSPSARIIPRNREALYAQSSMIEMIIKLGYKADRSDIDDFVLVLCAAHHPQAKPFLLDVLRNPEAAPNLFGATDPSRKGSVPPQDNSDLRWGPKERLQTSKWKDSSGAGWEDARIFAAAGLAELGEPEGMRWLLITAKPHPDGINSDQRKKCEHLLANLTGIAVSEGHDKWVAWWQQNKADFHPKRTNMHW